MGHTQGDDVIAKSHEIKLNPETMGERVNASVASATGELHNLVNSTRSDMSEAARELRGLIGTTRARWQQDRWLFWIGLGGVVLGILLYALLAGLIARAMPDSWQLPERMATRALAEPTLWDAGTHLMQRASPASREGIVAAANLARDNRETIEACGAAAAKAKKTVRCTIRTEEHTSELQSLIRTSYAVFCLKKKNRHRGRQSPSHHRWT